jgi:hypothetical protein
MKTDRSVTKVEGLPKKHVAILFEGSWFFVQDPEDPKRILAYCPYTNAPNHTCEFGFWTGSAISAPGGGKEGIMQEGDSYRVDVKTDKKGGTSFQKLFETAHKKYHFPYLNGTDPTNKLKLTNTDRMRCVSISMPNSLRVGGMLTNATVSSGPRQSNHISYSMSEKVFSYVTFVFVYEYHLRAEVHMGTNFLEQVVFKTKTKKPHLIFRVRSVDNNDGDGCPLDCAGDHTHLVKTFDAVRKMVYLPAPKGKSIANRRCDIAIYPTPGQQLEFQEGDTGLKRSELGLPPANTPRFKDQVPIGDYAACATGPAASGST